MTISSTTSKNQYTGNGSNTVFAYTFKIFEEGDIAVFLGDTEQTITTHYTVSGVGNDAGGNITFVTAPGNGVVVTLKRAEPLLQSIDYTENDDFPAAAHEEGLDRSVIRDQTIQEKLDRALVLSEGSTVSGITFPDPTGNALLYPRVNAAADNFEYFDITNLGVTTTTAYTQTLLDDASASEARTTLGAQEGLDGASLTTATVATGDKVLIQDVSDSDNLKTVTAQAIANLSLTPSITFSATATSTQDNVTGDGTSYPIIFNAEIVDAASVYNSSTGVFTATTAGMYHLSTTVNIHDHTATNTTGNLMIVTSNRTYTLVFDPSSIISGNTSGSIALSVLADMSVGHTAYVAIQLFDGTKIVDITTGGQTIFSGAYVGAL